MNIRVVRYGRSPSTCGLARSQIFVKELARDDGEDVEYWVLSWDGRESWTIGDAYETEEEAIDAAREAIAQRGGLVREERAEIVAARSRCVR